MNGRKNLETTQNLKFWLKIGVGGLLGAACTVFIAIYAGDADSKSLIAFLTVLQLCSGGIISFAIAEKFSFLTDSGVRDEIKADMQKLGRSVARNIKTVHHEINSITNLLAHYHSEGLADDVFHPLTRLTGNSKILLRSCLQNIRELAYLKEISDDEDLNIAEEDLKETVFQSSIPCSKCDANVEAPKIANHRNAHGYVRCGDCSNSFPVFRRVDGVLVEGVLSGPNLEQTSDNCPSCNHSIKLVVNKEYDVVKRICPSCIGLLYFDVASSRFTKCIENSDLTVHEVDVVDGVKDGVVECPSSGCGRALRIDKSFGAGDDNYMYCARCDGLSKLVSDAAVLS